MLTSALPGEGKSATAVSLAVTTGMLGHRTVVVDLDLHRCGVGRALQVDPGAAQIRDYLVGKSRLQDIIQPVPEAPNLDAILAGPGPDLPSTLLSSEKLSKLVEALRSRYEVVILDSPAALIVNDVNFLAPLADAAVLVVRWGHSKENELKEAIERLRLNRIPLVGTCINRVTPSEHIGNGYGYGYDGASDYFSGSVKYKSS